MKSDFDVRLEQIRETIRLRKGRTVATSIARRLRTDRRVYSSNDASKWEILLYTNSPSNWITIDETASVRRRTSANLAARYDRVGFSSSALLSDQKFLSVALPQVANWSNVYPNMEAQSQIVRHIKRLGVTTLVSPGATLTSPASPSVAIAGAEILQVTQDTIEMPDEKSTARVKTKRFVAPDMPENPYWYESKDDEALYQDFIEMHKAGHTVNMLIAGPSGSGKTHGILNLGRKIGIPVHVVNCQAITTPEKWIGQMHADMVNGTNFVPSQHVEWVERTHADCANAEFCIILYDEITRLRPELNNMTYSLFDKQRGLEVPQMGRRIMMAPENIVIATANIGAAFTGTHTQDRAFRERFPITLERDFPPVAEEQKILEINTGLEKNYAKMLVDVAAHSRKLWRSGDLDSPISTRTLENWALFVSGGYTPKKAAEYTVLPMYSDDGGAASDRAKITSTIEGKVSA